MGMRGMRALGEPSAGEGICVVVGGLAGIALGFIAWVWFVALCVRLATAWGWLP